MLFTLDVDGERFAIHRTGDGGTAYDWLSGPNKGYGFGSSGTPNRPVEEHRESIGAFLAMIDPNTGVQIVQFSMAQLLTGHLGPSQPDAPDPTQSGRGRRG